MILKAHDPFLFFFFFPKFSVLFSVSLEESSLQGCKFQNFGWNGQAIWMYVANLYITVVYILLCKLSYVYHNQAHFH